MKGNKTPRSYSILNGHVLPADIIIFLMPWYLYHALKQLFPSGRFFSFFSCVSIIGVTLGVMVLLIVQSVMNGFGHEIRKKVADFNGDVRIMNGGIMYNWKEVRDDLESNPAVKAMAPYAGGVLMLQHRRIPAFPIVKGVDILTEGDVVPMRDYLQSGKLEDLDDDGIFLSIGLAQSIGAYEGSRVEVYTPLMLERMQRDEILLPRELTVRGIYKTGYGTYDTNTIVVTLRLMQELWSLGNGVHGISVKLDEGVDVDTFTANLNKELVDSPARAVSWIETNRDLLFILQLEKTVMFFIIIFIIIVASFSIAIALTMSVVRKTREIGLLVAMGARPSKVAVGFMTQGVVIGLVGAILGVGGALVALHFRNDVVRALAKITESEAAFLRFYQFADIPVYYLISDFVLVVVFTIILTTLAGLIPALKAGRLKPADALRSE